MRRARRSRWLFILGMVGLGAIAWGPRVARADARTDYLVRILETSTTFRVRAQAALSLARVEATPEVVDALARALADEHASVRVAAASSLERLADPRALPALREASRDRDRDVRRAVTAATRVLERAAEQQASADRRARPTARYYVGVGLPGTRIESLDPSDLEEARSYIRRKLSEIDGVVIAPEGETTEAADAVLRSRGLSGFFLDASIVRLESVEGGGLRAQVSVIVNTYPGRNMRAMLQGAATVQGASAVETARRQAIQGALSGALRRVSEAFEESAGGREG